MRTWLAALTVVTVATGCGFGSQALPCTSDAQCQSAVREGGKCEVTGLCSFTDLSCESHRRYGDLAGNLSGECVPGQSPTIDAGIDASIDAPPLDAQVCFGSGIVRVCLAEPPTQPLTISTNTQINTGDAQMCAKTTSGADGYCVLAGTDISITARLRGTGPKPLVLIAVATITSTAAGIIDVGSHRMPQGGELEPGAGAETASCAAGTSPTNSGGGAGGSFVGKGGNGGVGAASGSTAGMSGAAVSDITTLRGGCRGQNGAGTAPGLGGLGGGAVFLIAGTSITIGGTINAAGEGGTGGVSNTSGGGGGGSGGMIGFEAPAVMVDSLLLASGGGGGEGSREDNSGSGGPGSEPTVADPPAAGGSGAVLCGNGGTGSPATVAGAGGNGGAGEDGNIGNNRGAGGGGGGGAGIIKAPATATFTKEISPPSTP